MIANPIIHKEVLSSLRTVKAVLIQAFFLLVLAGLVSLFWPEGGLQDLGGQQARRVLAVIAIGELLMVAMFAAAFTAASLTIEKEKRTWEVLFATAMKPWQIAFGKITGSLGFLLLLVVSGLPALATLFLLGGVPGGDVLAVAGVLLLTVLYLGTIGLLISSISYRSYRAVVFTYAVVLVLCFAAAAPAWPVSGNLMTGAEASLQKLLYVVASFSPLQAMVSVVMPASDYCPAVAGMPAYWQVFIPVSLISILVTGGIALFKLRQPLTTEPQRVKGNVVERGKISARSFLFIIDPLKRKQMIRWWQNPMLMKEFRTRPMLQAQWLLRAVAICLFAALLVMILVAVSMSAMAGKSADMPMKMATVVAAMMVVLMLLIGPSLAGGTLSADRETGIWDVMRTTRLSSWRMVSGKFQSSVLPMLLFALATLPALLILLWFNPGLSTNVVHVCAVIGMTILFVATAGMFFSGIFSKTSTATAWTYALVVALALLALLAILGKDLLPRGVVKTIFVCNPIAAAMEAAGYRGLGEYGLWIPNIEIMAAATVVMFAVTIARIWQLRRPT
jgi:ABC-type transport system involved in multi-copper enzyme maturation permease subunit